MIRFGLLGAGRIGQIHGRNAAALANGKLIAIADAMPDAARKLASATGAAVREIDAIIEATDIDAVMICSPTDSHADQIEACAKAGKAIFCEKPIDLDVARAQKTIALVDQQKATLMLGFNRRFDPNFAALKARIVRGDIGEVEIVTILSRDPSPPPVSYIVRSGGLFRDMMIHDFDMARFLLGEEIVSVSAAGSCLVDPAIGKAGDVDTAVAQLRTESGKLAQISNSRRATYGYDQRVEVHGSKGMLRAANMLETTVELADAKGFRQDPAMNFFLERYMPAYRAELDAFIKAVMAKTSPNPSGKDGLAALVLADAATRSAKTGVTVKV